MVVVMVMAVVVILVCSDCPGGDGRSCNGCSSDGRW